MRLRTLLLVGCLATFGAGCSFVSSAAEVNQGMQSEDADERELAMLEGRLLLTLGGGTVGVLLLFFGIRWYMESLGTSAERTTELAAERAAGSPLGVLTLAVVIPASDGDPPPLPRVGAHVDQLLDLVGTLRGMRARWRFVGARGTPAMNALDSEAEATRLSGVYRSRVSAPPDYRGVNDGWLALVTVRGGVVVDSVSIDAAVDDPFDALVAAGLTDDDAAALVVSD